MGEGRTHDPRQAVSFSWLGRQPICRNGYDAAVSLLALVVTAVLGGAVPDASGASDASPSGGTTCDGGDGSRQSVDETAPLLVRSTPLGRTLRGLSATAVGTSLEVDEQHTRFTLTSDEPLAPLRLPLTLPSPWNGTLQLTPRPGVQRWCARVTVVVFDKELRRAELSALPVDVTITVTRRGQAPRTFTSSPASLVVTSAAIALGPEPGSPVLVVATRNRALPGDELLEGDGAAEMDASRYMASLAALFPDVARDIRARPSREAQRVLFAEMAVSLRAELGAWTPARRLAEIARFDEKAVSEGQRALLSFWKAELAVRRARSETSSSAPARLIVDDAVKQLWIDGVEVFDRDKGMPTSVELVPPAEAVRAWIVSSAPATDDPTRSIDVVHDTRAVLRPGELYSVTSTFVQHARPAARRECVRVAGTLPGGKDIRWREVSGARTALLDDDETYRPSVASAERVITVVPGGDARPFPPVPLIYSYTHPGTYKWTLAKDGGVTLELVEDEAICPP